MSRLWVKNHGHLRMCSFSLHKMNILQRGFMSRRVKNPGPPRGQGSPEGRKRTAMHKEIIENS
jgi:hypothetical protein